MRSLPVVIALLGAWLAVEAAVIPDLQKQNVIDVPKQCKPNEQLDSTGVCRPVWRQNDIVVGDLAAIDNGKNVIDVPRQCRPNEQLDPNGRCRPIWRRLPSELEAVPQRALRFLECLREKLRDSSVVCKKNDDASTLNVVDVPKVCPAGQQLDQNGRCRPIFRRAEE